MFRSWIGLSFDAALLGLETQGVIALRLTRLAAGGPAARAEGLRMVTEKSMAMVEAAATLASGGSAKTVVRRYRTHVRANRRRLSRKPPR